MGDSVSYAYAVTPGVGQVWLSAEQVQEIARVIGPEGRIELNSFMQLIVHTPNPDTEDQTRRLRALGLGTYPIGRVVKNLHTCTFCMGERVDGLPDARRLDEVVAGTPVPYTVRVGFSGCHNNCGEALARDIGVVRMTDGAYDIYVGGKAGGLTPQFGQKAAEQVSAAALPAAVQAILQCYAQGARGKERFWKFVNRIGLEPLRSAMTAASAAEAPLDPSGPGTVRPGNACR